MRSFVGIFLFFQGSDKVAELLIENGADVNAFEGKSVNAETPLHVAARLGNSIHFIRSTAAGVQPIV